MITNPILKVTTSDIEHFSDYYQVKLENVIEYISTLIDHVSYVIEYGNKIGVNEYQLSIHDLSKLSYAELPYYIKRFTYDTITEDIKLEFDYAWHHHVIKNPHHHEHWVISPTYIIPMPYNYILEMVADWHGANMAYQKSWNSTEWLKKNLPRMKLHSMTKSQLIDILHQCGYSFINEDSFNV